MTTTKPIAAVTGKQRKLIRKALEIAQAEGCSTKGACISFPESGHPKVTVEGPDGNPIRFSIASSPKETGREMNNVKRRLRTAIRRAEALACD